MSSSPVDVPLCPCPHGCPQIGERIREYMRETLRNEYGVHLDNRRNRLVTEAWNETQREVRRSHGAITRGDHTGQSHGAYTRGVHTGRSHASLSFEDGVYVGYRCFCFVCRVDGLCFAPVALLLR